MLGKIVSAEGIAVDPSKVEVIQLVLPPRNTKELLRLILGQVRWHGRMLRYLADVAVPLNNVLSLPKFEWSRECNKAFRTLKLMLAKAPIVQPPQWDLPFHIFVDALDVAIGVVLMQARVPDWFRPVYYASRRLSSAEKNYSMTEREALGMVYAVNKFWHYLLGNKFTFHVDHSALVYLVAKQALHGKFARWMLILTEFEFTVIHMPSKEHAILQISYHGWRPVI